MWNVSEFIRFFVPVYAILMAMAFMYGVESAPKEVDTSDILIVLGDPNRWGGSCSIEVYLDNLSDMMDVGFIETYANCYRAFEEEE